MKGFSSLLERKGDGRNEREFGAGDGLPVVFEVFGDDHGSADGDVVFGAVVVVVVVVRNLNISYISDSVLPRKLGPQWSHSQCILTNKCVIGFLRFCFTHSITSKL